MARVWKFLNTVSVSLVQATSLKKVNYLSEKTVVPSGSSDRQIAVVLKVDTCRTWRNWRLQIVTKLQTLLKLTFLLQWRWRELCSSGTSVHIHQTTRRYKTEILSVLSFNLVFHSYCLSSCCSIICTLTSAATRDLSALVRCTAELCRRGIISKYGLHIHRKTQKNAHKYPCPELNYIWLLSAFFIVCS